jgi:hypothetical protein
MFIRFSFSKAFDWYIIIIYKLYFVILFDQNTSKIIYLIVSRNSRKYALFNKTPFFFQNEKTDSWENTWLIYNQGSSIDCMTQIFFIFTFIFFDFLRQTVQYQCNSPIYIFLPGSLCVCAYTCACDDFFFRNKVDIARRVPLLTASIMVWTPSQRDKYIYFLGNKSSPLPCDVSWITLMDFCISRMNITFQNITDERHTYQTSKLNTGNDIYCMISEAT